jgi:hypothetical protein
MQRILAEELGERRHDEIIAMEWRRSGIRIEHLSSRLSTARFLSPGETVPKPLHIVQRSIQCVKPSDDGGSDPEA